MNKPVKLKPIYFDARTGSYWMEIDGGRFLNLDGRNCKIHMMRQGFRIDEEDSIGLKSGDQVLSTAQLKHYVDYAGPLAGHRPGLLASTGGKRILVTSGVEPVAPEKKETPRLDKFFGELLGHDQSQYALYWLKVAWESLRDGNFTPGQLMALAGPAGCGKSFFHVLVTMLLGGRMAKPYRYMTGQTAFNSDLAGAEHLVIEDENARTNAGARREFGTAIKDWTVNESISVHAKGREAITLAFWRRLSLSCNWEPEYLMILPPLDESILDKIFLFKCSPAKLSKKREANIKMLTDELPGLAYILERLKIPKALIDDRFGVRAYHNPELLEALSDVSDENRLENLIDEVIKFDPKDMLAMWKGTAEELEAELRKSSFAFAVDRLLRYASAMGTFLSRLASKNPARYESRKNSGRTVWIIRKREESK